MLCSFGRLQLGAAGAFDVADLVGGDIVVAVIVEGMADVCMNVFLSIHVSVSTTLCCVNCGLKLFF